MNFNIEIGYPHWKKHSAKYHRYKYDSPKSRCSSRILLWELYMEMKIPEPILLSDICKKCLSTFSAEEIEDLKHWLILKKLGVSV